MSAGSGDFTAFKTMPAVGRPARYVETPAHVRRVAERFGELRRVVGDDIDLAIDFHGAISPATAKLLIKALEPHQPMFFEEPCAAQNHDVMAELARGTHLPIATGERVYTKWGFHEVLGYLKRPFAVRDGYIDLPTGPGLGIELDEDAMADKIGHDWTNREAYDVDDGSVMDW